MGQGNMYEINALSSPSGSPSGGRTMETFLVASELAAQTTYMIGRDQRGSWTCAETERGYVRERTIGDCRLSTGKTAIDNKTRGIWRQDCVGVQSIGKISRNNNKRRDE